MITTSTFFKTTTILGTAIFSILGGCAIEDPIDYTTGYAPTPPEPANREIAISTDNNETLTLLQKINSSVYGYDETTSVPTLVAALEGTSSKLKIVATPTYNGIAENMGSEAETISSSGKFNITAFDSTNNLKLSSGFNNSILNDMPYLGFVGFANGKFYGSGIMLYNQYTDNMSVKLSDLFNPNQQRSLYGYILNENGSNKEYTSLATRTIFSNSQSPGTNGYHSSSKFSGDDGAWGFSDGISLDANSGGTHSGLSSYGAANHNSSDSNANTFYWDTTINTTSYIFYIFVVYE